MYKSFGGMHVLHDVGLHVKHGEVHTLLGENGSREIHPDEDHHWIIQN
jgi:ABC-type sugar transport system ATPase subunit